MFCWFCLFKSSKSKTSTIKVSPGDNNNYYALNSPKQESKTSQSYQLGRLLLDLEFLFEDRSPALSTKINLYLRTIYNADDIENPEIIQTKLTREVLRSLTKKIRDITDNNTKRYDDETPKIPDNIKHINITSSEDLLTLQKWMEETLRTLDQRYTSHAALTIN